MKTYTATITITASIQALDEEQAKELAEDLANLLVTMGRMWTTGVLGFTVSWFGRFAKKGTTVVEEADV